MTCIVQHPDAYNHIDMFGPTLPFTWAVIDNNSTILCTKKQLNNIWSIYKCGNTKTFLETKWLLIWIIFTKADEGKTSYIKEQNHNSLLRLDGNKQLRPNHDTWWCPPSSQ